LAWCIAWFFLTADKPEEHKIISDLERDYIVEETKGNISTGNKVGNARVSKFLSFI